jgi:uncharacterized membrane protein YfcA
MNTISLFLICFFSSCIGAVVGAGGGVIIKPILDMSRLLSVSVASFCSGCTVFTMALCSLLSSGRKEKIKLHLKISIPLALGSIAGGITGRLVFEKIRHALMNENALGGIQSLCQLILMVIVCVYILIKEKISSFRINNSLVSITIGFCLGLVSVFLGIGGGPVNMAFLFLFYSMETSEAVKNSLFIIVFSQAFCILSTFITQSIPSFYWRDILAMVSGGAAGGIAGKAMSRQMGNKDVKKLLLTLVISIIAINLFNVLRFFGCPLSKNINYE